MSTNSGNAPACEMASVVAMNVCGTVTTTSPGFTPLAIRAKRRASVPLLTATECCGFAEGRECLLEFFDHRAADEAGGPQGFVKNCGQLLLEFHVRSNQIKKRNIVGNAHSVTSMVCSI